MQEFIWIIQLLSGMLVITAGSAILIAALIHFARSLKINESIIAVILVGFASALPEYVIAVNAYIYKVPELIFANAIGTSIVSLSLIAGMIAIFKKDFSTKKILSSYQYIILSIAVTLPILFSLDGTISRLEGILLLIVFAFYIIHLWINTKNIKLNFPETNKKNAFLLLAMFLATFSIFLSGEFLVSAMQTISFNSGLSIFLITIALLAPIGAIPELIYEFELIRKKESSLTFGDLFTSIVINTTFILGIISVFSPIHVVISPTITFSLLFLSILILIFNILIKTKERLSWKEGILLVMLYTIFIGSSFLIYIASM
ncbi:MAG: hypothetical protein WCJ58_05755 [bacterium]